MRNIRKGYGVALSLIVALVLGALIDWDTALAQGNDTGLYLPLVVDATQVPRPEDGQIPAGELRALEMLYQSTQGQAWSVQTDWLQTDSPCSWHGIECIQGHVSTLDLPQNNLAGALPAEIGDLSYLAHVYLYGNAIASLPSSLGALANLQQLDLSDNQLTGLPPEIGDLGSLIELDLEGNAINELPAEIGHLAQLEDLNLASNQLSTLPAEIGELSSLRGLYLWNNQLTDLPAEVGNLANLEAIYAWGNRLSSLPADFGRLGNLKWLSVSDNLLTSLPAEIASTDPVQLDISGNCLSALSDPALTAWLDAHDPDWLQNQRLSCTP